MSKYQKQALSHVLDAMEGADMALSSLELDPNVKKTVVEARTILLGAIARLDTIIAEVAECGS